MVGCGLSNGKIVIWDIRDQKVIQNVNSHQTPITLLQFSQRGAGIVSASKGSHILKRFSLKKSNHPGIEAFLPEGSVISDISMDRYSTYLGALYDNKVSIWDIKDLSKIVHTVHSVSDKVNGFKFSKAKDFLATTGSDGLLKIYK